MESPNQIVKDLFNINPLQTDIGDFMKMGLPEDSITEQIECIQSMIDDKYNKASIHSLNGLIVRLNLFTELLAERDRLREEVEQYKSGSFMKEAFDSNQNLIFERDRLKEENKQVSIELLSQSSDIIKSKIEVARLEEVNKELMEALRRFVTDINYHPSVAAKEHYKDIMIQTMSAIAKYSKS